MTGSTARRFWYRVYRDPVVDYSASLSEAHAAYLSTQLIGRLATVGPTGAPHNVPVGFRYNADLGTIDIGGYGLPKSRKYRNVLAEPRVSFVVDDLASIRPWVARGVEIRGTAEVVREGGEALGPPGMAPEFIRIIPTRVASWGL